MGHTPSLNGGDPVVLFGALVVDFLLAVVFFTALAYATLSKRLEHQRAAAAMSAVLGIALATGLVWWERDHNVSIRTLGPVALVLAVVFLALAIFAAVRRAAGSLAAIGVAVVLGLLFAGMLGVQAPISTETATTILVLLIMVSALALAFRHHQPVHAPVTRPPAPIKAQVAPVRVNSREARQARQLSERLWHGMHDLRHRTATLKEHPEARTDLLLQLQRMLPAEGWLTDRMAALRERIHHMRSGHLSRIGELRQIIKTLPPTERRKAGEALVARYRSLAGIENRIERLDRTVATTERRIRELTREAELAVAQYEFRRFDQILKKAEKLQDHNTRLCRVIGRTEEQLIHAMQQAVKASSEVNHA